MIENEPKEPPIPEIDVDRVTHCFEYFDAVKKRLGKETLTMEEILKYSTEYERAETARELAAMNPEQRRRVEAQLKLWEENSGGAGRKMSDGEEVL